MAPSNAPAPTHLGSAETTVTSTGLDRHRGISVTVQMEDAVPGATRWMLHWILRVAVAACFIGHGAFGIITKAAWIPYFAMWGIPERWAWPLMPVVGTVDIAVGVLTLFRPVRAVVLYMVFWGLQTALLRPLAGQGVWEFLERAGNFGVPFAFLLLLGRGRSLADWFSARLASPLSHARVEPIAWTLRITAAMLLIGHGGFGFAMRKADWTGYFGALGITAATVETYALAPLVGWFECALGLLVLAAPVPSVLVFAFLWKVGTELLRPVVGEPFWEFIERGGSYAAPLALLVVARSSSSGPDVPSRDDGHCHGRRPAAPTPAPH